MGLVFQTKIVRVWEWIRLTYTIMPGLELAGPHNGVTIKTRNCSMKAYMWMAFLGRNGRLKIHMRVQLKRLKLSLPNVPSSLTARVKKTPIKQIIDATELPRPATTMRVYWWVREERMKATARETLPIKNVQQGNSTMTWNRTSKSANARLRIKNSFETSTFKICKGNLASTVLGPKIPANQRTQIPPNQSKRYSKAVTHWSRWVLPHPYTLVREARPRTKAASKVRQCW